jgi:phosphate starvation-inducible PhoH-like protein
MFRPVWGKRQVYDNTGILVKVDLPRRTISGLKEAILVLKDVQELGLFIWMTRTLCVID